MAAQNLLDRLRSAFGAQARSDDVQVGAFAGGDGYGTGPLDAGIGGGTPLLRYFRPMIRDAAGDTLRGLPTQRAQIRELVRTNPIAGGAINTNTDRVVGTGLALVVSPDRDVLGWDADQAQEWKRKTQTEFALWADGSSCDWDGELNFYAKQALTLRAALESGDCFTVLPDGNPTPSQPYALRLQTIEADRVGNPGGTADTDSVAGGVWRKVPGGPKSYFVYDRHPGATFFGAGATLYSGQWMEGIGASGRRRILHHFRQLRPEQPRGVPYLAPVIEHIKQMGRYSEAEIQAAVMSAMFTVFIESPSGEGIAPIVGMDSGQVAASGGEIGLAPGAVVGLAPGETANFADPKRPSTAFEPFVRAVMTQIGMGLGIPVEVLLKQYNASYSASKAALLDAWMWFRTLRAWLAGSFCQPVYETWLAEAVASGRVAAPGFFSDPLLRWAYTRADWHGDSQGSINPKDEVAAYLSAIDGRLMTRERATWELFGSDWLVGVSTMAEEQALLKENDLLPMPAPGAPAPEGVGRPAPPVPGEPAKPVKD